MKTILKWPGGKEKELPIIRDFTPDYSGRFIEPFVGGGAVFFDTATKQCCINDKSDELINLYNCARNKDQDLIRYLQQENDEFQSLGTLVDENREEILSLYHSDISIEDFINNHIDYFSSLADNYNDVFIKEIKRNLKSKINRSAKLEKENGAIPDSDRIDNIEAALKSAYYMFIRYLQNHLSELSIGRQAAVFFFVREYCYSSMFRYNKDGDFNVPYGGISYNRKDFQKKIDYLLSEEMHAKLNTADIYCEDFETFINSLNLTSNDFVFLDPPYDSDFSTYAQNEFGQAEQIRLCNCLKATEAKILLVIKNTEFIYNLYKDDFKISSFDKKYLVSFMNRNDRDVKHLIITNY
ncbi:DNA adenine methylase [Butyrivibrio sp. YAB3001]|uniref:DNA adenine methylase n=1 Tax=Butyrivibrio sp. YAB3001 TaxID=1520812 RepID=UPI0008F63972|nr:DNA adenine methylase [Butyrivibrio sp. YAB3001]SFC56660.1 DNA adenine methylase [Butyrivibrio sp. YAB3001]